MSAPKALPTAQLFRLLLWVQWRSFLARLRGIGREAPLLLFVLASFIVGYLALGYWLFYGGLNYLHHFPIVGALLSQRILYLIFGFFFVMLAFSNVIIGYSTLFRNRETYWFLSLPLAHRDVYRWKFFEALAISSWALIFLSAPMMIAYGRVHEVPLLFYLQVGLVYVPFVVIAALLGSWVIVFLVRILARREVQKILLIAAPLIVLGLIFGIQPITDSKTIAHDDLLSFHQLLQHTRVTLNPFLPSAWLAQSILSWGEGLMRQGAFFFLLLLSNALFGLLLGFEVVGRFFYGSWTISLSSRAERFQRQAQSRRHRECRPSLLERATDLLRPISPPMAALVLKDVRLFWRDPAQWIQFMIFFGLLCIYVLNLRNVALDLPRDQIVVVRARVTF